MKLCIVTASLGSGGAERSAALQSIMFTKLGHEVHIVLISNIITYDYEGIIFNLGKLKDKSNSLFDKVNRIIILRKYFEKNNFDFIVDNRMRTNSIFNEIGLCKYAYWGFKVFFVIHSVSYKNEIQKNTYYKKWLLNKAYRMIAVNEKLANLLEPYHNDESLVCIENAVDLRSIKLKAKDQFNFDSPYILYCGRLVEECKNISLLIKAYGKSKVYEKAIKLIILGDGDDKKSYQALVAELKIESHVVFVPFKSNPFVYMKHAICTVLTSHYEGFSLVLVESLACGTPIIAINCETGPSEIVKDKVNGVLVETYDIKEWALVLKRTIDNEDELNFMKGNAIESVDKYGIDQIAKKWQKVFTNKID